MVKVKCNYCGETISKFPCQIREQNYCSLACFHKARRGKPPWNKGIPFSKESKEKMKQAKLGRDLSYLHTPEMENKAREALIASGKLKGKWQEPEYREKMLKHLGELNTSLEHRISSAKGARRSHELHPEFISFAREGLKNPVARRRLSEGAKRQWQRMKVEMIRAQRQGMKRPNKIESVLLSILSRNFPKEWKYVGDGKVVIGNLVPDFINVNGRKEIIELFGDYWHGPKVEQPYKTEKERKDVYNEYGYRMLVIWEHEIRKLQEGAIIEKIRRFQCK